MLLGTSIIQKTSQKLIVSTKSLETSKSQLQLSTMMVILATLITLLKKMMASATLTNQPNKFRLCLQKKIHSLNLKFLHQKSLKLIKFLLQLLSRLKLKQITSEISKKKLHKLRRQPKSKTISATSMSQLMTSVTSMNPKILHRNLRKTNPAISINLSHNKTK